MNISKEAIEAAARGLYETTDHWEQRGVAWEAAGPPRRDYFSRKARAALEAAAPLLMAQALREMAEAFEPTDADPAKEWHPHDVAELLRWRASDITA